MYLCFAILVVAIMCDVSSGRIPKQVTSYGMLLSQAWLVYNASFYDGTVSLINAFLIVLVLYPLFMIGTLGAGDIKLIMILPVYLSLSDSIRVVFFAFAAGAVIGGIRLMMEGTLRERIVIFFRYVKRVSADGKLTLYENDVPGFGGIGRNQIHFSIPVMIGTMIVTGGF